MYNVRTVCKTEPIGGYTPYNPLLVYLAIT